MSINNIDERTDLVVYVWKRHMDEYKLWAREHGDEHMKEWIETNGSPVELTSEFAYFIATKFMEWRNGIVEGN